MAEETGTTLDVLLTHGLRRDHVERLRAQFPHLEDAAASLSHHEDDRCTTLTPQPCPWHAAGPLAGDLAEVSHAINAWLAVGWLERGLLADERLPQHDSDITHRRAADDNTEEPDRGHG